VRRLPLATLLCCCAHLPATGTAAPAALRDAWLEAFNARQLDAVLALYADDGVFLPITGERVAGRDALRALYTKVFGEVTAHLELHSEGLERSADLAFDTGTYRESVDAGGKHVALTGSYLFTYRHTEAGWRVSAQSWTEVPALPGAHPIE
jgi:uncharacterized protein (TIGR02246 family)